MLSALPKRLNVASMIGHTPLRLFVMGEEALVRAATPDEAERMRALVFEALRAGAIGFATSLSPNHQGERGLPIPSRNADRAEIWHIASALREAEQGIVQVTTGPGFFQRESSQLATWLSRPVTWAGLLTRGGEPWPWWAEESDRGSPLELVRRQAELPGEVWPQISCRDLVMQVVLSDPMPFAMLPAMSELLALPRAQRTTLYSDAEWCERARGQIDGYWGTRWSKTFVEETELHPETIGVPLDELAAQRRVHPFDLMVRLSLDENLRTRFKVVIANDDSAELAELLAEPTTLIGLSDAGAHASQLSDACYSTHLLGRWVREKGALSLEAAVWRLTGQVASVFGIRDRGRIRPGYRADLVAFDADTVGPTPVRRVHDLPAGADRLISQSTGIHGVWVNGTRIVTDSSDTFDNGAEDAHDYRSPY